MATASRECAQLTEFSKTVWGKPGALLKCSGNIKYIDLNGHKAFQALFAGEVDDKILVRDEYHAALEELQKDTYRRGAYVTGQPGIGKSMLCVLLDLNTYTTSFFQAKHVSWPIYSSISSGRNAGLHCSSQMAETSMDFSKTPLLLSTVLPTRMCC